MGSPPQVRGKPVIAAATAAAARITPAGAGKTYIKISFLSVLQDHPRRCGENKRRRNLNLNQQGSPPQVRGKLASLYLHRFACGITPAGAGKTYLCMHCGGFLQDHPRRCGENPSTCCR